ncbi:MAG TPA: hypothetical protein VN031_02275 [Candidatus Microsaccharimonas sp.]|nr:hypothetical protein [Candidatus Microsaccharimonas sp.]
MSTKNIKDLSELLEAAEKADAAIAENATSRAQELLKEQREAEKRHEKAVKAAEIRARARAQLLQDESAVRDEEAAQLNNILGNGVASSQSAPVAAQPAAPAQVDDPVDPPTSVQPSVAPAPAAKPAIDPRNWGWLAWLLAVAGFVVCLIIALVIGAPHAHQHAVQWVVNILWYIGLMGVGFFAGGLIGCLLDEQTNDGS